MFDLFFIYITFSENTGDNVTIVSWNIPFLTIDTVRFIYRLAGIHLESFTFHVIMSSALFKTVLSQHPPVKNIFIANDSDYLILFGYVSSTVCISKFLLSEGVIYDKKHVFDGEVGPSPAETVNYYYFCIILLILICFCRFYNMVLLSALFSCIIQNIMESI